MSQEIDKVAVGIPRDIRVFIELKLEEHAATLDSKLKMVNNQLDALNVALAGKPVCSPNCAQRGEIQAIKSGLDAVRSILKA